MPAFIPPGLVPLHAALGRAAQALFSDRWAALGSAERELFEATSAGDWRRSRYSRAYPLGLDVFGRLRPLAAAGLLPALMRMPDGGPAPVAPEAWTSRAADSLDVVLSGTAPLKLADGRSVAGPILLRSADLDAVLCGEPAPSLSAAAPSGGSAPSMPSAAPRRRAGRPAKAGADDFWIETLRRMLAGESRAGQAELTREMAQWCSDWMADPYDGETVRKKLGRLFGALAAE